VKPKASAAPTRPLPDGQRGQPSGGTTRSFLQITILGSIAIGIAVFGRPTQALAAAVIVVALCALAQGRSVTRSTASVVGTILRALQGTNPDISPWPAPDISPWPAPDISPWPAHPADPQSARERPGTVTKSATPEPERQAARRARG
jgi:hypothetical protein